MAAEEALTGNQSFNEEFLADKENIPSNETPVEQSPDEPQQPEPQSDGLQSVATITIEPPSPGGKPAPTPNDSCVVTADTSTPTPTVRDRVREYTNKTGTVETVDGQSLSSSRSSLQAAFDKDDKDWILAASKADISAMRRILVTAGGSSGGSLGSGSCKRMVNYRFPFNGFTALHFAAKLNRPDCCKFLFENGANPDAKTYAGQTPLHMACFQENRQAIEYLVKLPCYASHTPDYSGKLPLELIRNRDAFDDILNQSSPLNIGKRGSFLGDLPSRSLLKNDDTSSLGGGASGGGGGGGGGGVVAASSSWLSGVRASFRSKSGSQTKLTLKPSIVGGLSSSGQQNGRVSTYRGKQRLRVAHSSDDSDS